SPIQVYASGDEFHNWLHDEADFSIVKNDEGWYVYAKQDGDSVAPTKYIVGRDNPALNNLKSGVNLSKQRIEAKYARYENTMRDYSNGRSPHSGQFNNIVIFIKFANDPEFSGNIGLYDAMFNATADYANSMKNYFNAASYNQLNVDTSFYPSPNGSIILSYTDINPRNYYRVYSSSNPIGYDEDDDNERTQREMQMLARAVAEVGPQIPANLSIDGDSDGYVDNTCFIIQGAPDGWAELLWPHRWVLYGVTATIHGARVWDFNFQLEYSLYSEGASVLAHEMFHSLGAPDLYRYDDNTITPIGAWDLMANNLNPPQHMSAWMKYRYGQWLPNPTMITESGTYTLHPVASSSSNNIYRVASWRANEYYLLEYRKPAVDYDDNLPGTGLLIYRQDTRYQGNASGPPDELYIYRPGANNTTTPGSLGSAVFSAQTGRTSINESTVPSGFTSNGSPGGLNVYNIGMAGETISFSIKISDVQLTSPIGGETWFAGSNKNITWKAKSTTGNVTLEYSTNMGQNWILLNSNAPNNGNYLWTNIPLMDSNQCQIRITLQSNSNWDSSTFPFSIVSTLATPVATYPASNAVNVPTNPQISWQNVAGASGYQFQLSADPEFESYVANVIGHPLSYFMATGLSPFTTYYWRVASIADIGISPFCDDLSFTTGNTTELPGIPDLLSPVNNATGVSVNPMFNWNSSFLATEYRLQIAFDPYFANMLLDISNVTGLSYNATNLLANTTFYWRVAGVNVAGISNFSLSRKFTTTAGSANDENLNPILTNKLEPNYPNPFNPSTTISLSVKDAAMPLSLNIYNTKGQLVRNLYSALPSANTMSLVWDGKDATGKTVSSGIYLYQIESGAFKQTRKMLLAK
ncbi:MAG: M6 family metalloprotease domain-containing protein, partial [Candidatus Cloacimonetes bacterium]|nr:M6 family metalloprotease domain-containing protein [Candidatus Cloacimonadota bacterium]